MGLSRWFAGVRRLSRRPIFALSAILLVAGTAAITVTVGAVARRTLLDALPYPEEQRLVALYWSNAERNIPDMSVTLLVMRELSERTTAFDGVAATLTPLNTTLTGPDGPRHLAAGLAMSQAFDILGVTPLIGRPFTAEEGEPGSSPDGAILSYEAWQGRFAGDPAILGATLVIDDRPWTVIGVLPARRSLAPEQREPIDVWLPMGAVEEILGTNVFDRPGAAWFRANARLSEGTPPERLPAELARLQETIGADYPETHGGWSFRADPLRQRVLGTVDGPVTALWLGNALLFGVAIVNLAGLFLQRAYTERRDTATRVALGATSADIRRLRSADGALIGAIGGLVGAVGVALALAALHAWDPLDLPAHIELRFAPVHALATIGVALAVTLAITWLSTVVPRTAHLGALTPGGPMAAGNAPGWGAHATLLVQVAATTALAIGAIAATRSLVDLRTMETGLRQQGILSARMEVPVHLYDPEDTAARARRVVDEMRALPDVDDAFLWSPQIPAEARTYTSLRIEGMSSGGERDAVARYHTVSPGAVSAFGIRFVAGRDMSDDDWNARRRVALVSESAADTWFGGTDAALGRRIQRTAHDDWSEVIGVVADAAFSGRYGPGSANTLDVFFMFDQDPRRTLLFFARPVRGGSDVDGLRAAAAAVIPELPLYDVRWMDDRLGDQERPHRNTAGFTGFYAVAALLLSVVGLAGSTAALVQRRRTEIGVRQALGASPGTVVREVLGAGTLAVLGGIGAGVVLAWLGLSFVDPTVLTVGRADLASHLGGALLVAAWALTALAVPPLAGVRRSPAECLRSVPRG